jgi:deazaflavin-dependent oxidoreductase (nitroreductase family)
MATRGHRQPAIRPRRSTARRLRRKIIQGLWWFHRQIYILTGGRVGGRIAGMPVLLLTTRGRRSGGMRTVTLTYLPDGHNFVVIASNGGAPRHPEWFQNLRAHSEAQVQIGRLVVSVTAREAGVNERERLWTQAVRAYRGYAAYQRRTSRRIPTVVLEPRT